MSSVNSSINSQNQDHQFNKYKHIDSPWLWFSVLVSSVSIHVLVVFFLLSSLSKFQFWNNEYNQDPINIEFIEIEPQADINPISAPETKSDADSSSKQTQTSEVSTAENIKNPSLGVDQKQKNSSTNNQINVGNIPVEPSPKLTIKPQLKPVITPEINIPPIPINTPEETTPVNDLPWNSRQDIKLGEGTPLSKNPIPKTLIPKPESSQVPKPENSPIPKLESSSIPKPENSQVPKPESSPIPKPESSQVPKPESSQVPKPESSPIPKLESSQIPKLESSQIPKLESSQILKPESSPIPKPENSQIPKPENSPIPKPEVTPISKGVGIRVNITPLLKDEVEKMRQENTFRRGALPDFLAEYKGSLTKDLELDVVLGDYGLKPANVLASLVIDQDGNFQEAIILDISPISLDTDKSIYEQALNQVFRQETFTAAYNKNGSKPGRSNLYMKIKVDIIDFN
ncbi:MAG: hypothetical protein F6K61_01945 [Sphaerospermopsis sp. SIO1G1]|nr:hypothetical protein [Sphaerospermopsis sp. SIO1G1]